MLDAQRIGVPQAGVRDVVVATHVSNTLRSPSVTRLTPTTSEAVARRIEQHRPPVAADQAVILRDRDAPVGGRRLNAEADEAQGSDEENRVAQAHRHLHDGDGQHVRQDLDEHDGERAVAAQPRRRHVVQLALDQHRRADRARDQRREHEADDQHHRGFEVPTAASAISATMTSGSACSASITRLATSSSAPRR